MKQLTSSVFAKPVSTVWIAGLIMVSVPLPAGVASEEPQSKPVTVKVNRTVPIVAAAPLTPWFSADPTDEEITRARVFDEPIVPMAGVANAAENRALAQAILAYLEGGGNDRLDPLRRFLTAYGESRWRASLLTGMGVTYRRTGHFSRALAAWEEAWSLAKESVDPRVKATADRAIGEVFELNARLGRFEVLERLFEEIDQRDIRGSATEKVSGARQALWLMHNRTGEAFRCGPLAIYSILRAAQPDLLQPKPIEMCKSTKQGTSLVQLRDLSVEVGRPMRMARRDPGAHVYTPSVIHWKVGHFAALVAVEEDRYLVRDPTFGDELWVSQTTLDEEASGYFLIDARILAPGWVRVDDQTGSRIWGKGVAAGVDPSDVGDEPECPTCGGGGMGPGRGLAVASIHMMLASIRLKDIPAGYSPPVGPTAYFRVTYNQREIFQPQTFYYSNLGPKWTLDWLSYIEDDPANLSAAVTVYKRNGGRETSISFDSVTQSYAPTARTQAVVKRLSASPIVYERELPHGGAEVFSQPDGAVISPRKVFLTAIKDSAGNALTFTYDANLRLVAATDAIGQVTTIAHEHSDPLKITKVTDPFGRSATFEYDTAGRLQRVTDVLGLQSSFAYGVGDVLKTLTTPYGTTAFTTGENGIRRWAELTDAAGGKERIEYGFGLTYSDPANVVPTGLNTVNAAIDHHNTLYWNKQAMAMAPGQRSAATDYHWALVSTGAYQAAAVPLSIKRPLENRTWYNYKGGGGNTEGTIRKVTATGRVIENGTTQLVTADYNSRGQITKRTDPVGRETIYEYDATGLKLLSVKQKNEGSYELLEARTYGAGHEPSTITDAAGQPTTYTYNSRGQVLSETNARSETTTYTYDVTSSRLTSVTGPISGAITSFTYDGYGRVRTTTDADGYALTTDYDVFDRPTRGTYPDGTYDETTYRYLDVQGRRDRLGRWTRFTYNAARHLTAIRYPSGSTIIQEWCGCGSLEALVDPNGNRTAWERDLIGRVTKEIRTDGSTMNFVYENTGSRLKTVTDALNQQTTFSYYDDDRLQQVVYTNALVVTPSVTFTYDSAYGRLATMVDGIGTTSYSYHPVTASPGLGALRLASVDGPLANDVITYQYDELGRVETRQIDGVGATRTFDSLGRVATEDNSLGAFTYTYDGTTDRLAGITYPNGQTTTYAYYGNGGDRRLATIHHRYPNTVTLSKFDYTYNASGNIVTWRQQSGSGSRLWEYGYDAAGQLLTAAKKSTDPTPMLLARYAYSYDLGGNRTAEQINDGVTGSSYNSMNRLVAQGPSGLLRVEGTLSEPAIVSIDGTPASVLPTNDFVGGVPIAGGLNTVTITATDGTGNAASNTYEVSSSTVASTFVYDANGNVTSDGTRAFEWNARNELAAVIWAVRRAEFLYSGIGERVGVVEKENGVTLSTTYWIWAEGQPAESRTPSGAVLQRLFSQGYQEGGSPYYFAKDHLGSIREVVDGNAAVRAEYDYDPWGRTARLSGDMESVVTFTGHIRHKPTELVMAPARAYDAGVGRWLSQDPMELYAGTNLYAYVGNDPIGHLDPSGLLKYKPNVPPATGELLDVLECMERCFGKELTVTSTSEPIKQHPPGTPHRMGLAADVRYPGEVNAKKVLCCAARCLAGYALDEKKNPSSKATAPHLHIQVTSGKRPKHSSGDLPPECRPDLTCKLDGSRRG